MTSTVTTLPNGVVVVTHILPPGSGMGLAVNPSPTPSLGQTVASLRLTVSSLEQTIFSMTGRFLKELGTVQIMIGLVMFLFSIATFNGSYLVSNSGIFVWGALFFIIAGSLTVATAHNGLMMGFMEMNVIAAVAAFVSLVFSSIDASYHGWYQDTPRGVPGVMAFFCVMEMIISICVSIFVYKSTSQSTTTQEFIAATHLPQGSTVMPTPPLYETLQVPKGPDEEGAHLNDQPPQYSPVSV